MPAVGADDELRARFELARGRRRAHACDSIAFPHEIGNVGLHPQAKLRVASPVLGEEVQEVPLRDHRDERRAHPYAVEVGDRDEAVAELGAQLVDFLVWKLEEFIQDAELVQAQLYEQIGRLKMELEWVKKKAASLG